MDNYLDDYLEDIADLCTDEVDEATVHKRWVYQRKRDKNGHPYGPSVKKAKWISSDPNYRVVIDPKTGNVKELKKITAGERRRRSLSRKMGGLIKWKSKLNLIKKRGAEVRDLHYKDRDKEKYVIQNASRDRGDSKGQEYDPKEYEKEKKKNQGPKLIHPVVKESYLVESPHVEFSEDIWWDFCSEAGWEDGRWLLQLIPLFTGKDVHSLRPDRNEGLLLNLQAMPKSYICKCLMDDMAFKGFAKQDFKQLSDYDKERIRQAIPRELYNFLNG